MTDTLWNLWVESRKYSEAKEYLRQRQPIEDTSTKQYWNFIVSEDPILKEFIKQRQLITTFKSSSLGIEYIRWAREKHSKIRRTIQKSTSYVRDRNGDVWETIIAPSIGLTYCEKW